MPPRNVAPETLHGKPEPVACGHPMHADSEYELNYILDCLGQGIRIIDKDFTVHRINQAFARISGIAPQDAIGKKCWEVFSGPFRHTPECRLQRIIAGEKIIQKWGLWFVFSRMTPVCGLC